MFSVAIKLILFFTKGNYICKENRKPKQQERLFLLAGCTDEMVSYSLGKPTTIDNREVTAKCVKFRWIYGVPRQGASYIWFKDGKVTKIKY